MVFAARHEYAVLTRDLDFTTALAIKQLRKPSVIQVRAELALPREMGPQVVAALIRWRSEIESGALVTIVPEKHRIRLLPLNASQ